MAPSMADIFPAQYSTLSAVALGVYIEQTYGFKVLSCKLLLHGVSDTYVVVAEHGKYILKIYRAAHRSAGEIAGEVELLQILKESGSPVAYVVPDAAGDYVQAFQAAEGLRHGVLYVFAAGKSNNDLTEEQLLITGRTMAEIHNVTATITLANARREYTIETMVHGPLNVLRDCFVGYAMEQQYEWLSAAAQEIIARFERLEHGTFSTGYCHYDYFPKNFFFDEANNITLFDFDFAGKGVLVNDLASIFVFFFLRMEHGALTETTARAAYANVVSGYQKVRPISNTELSAVPHCGFMLLLFYLGFQYENYDDWSNSFFGPNYLAGRIASMKRYKELFCEG